MGDDLKTLRDSLIVKPAAKSPRQLRQQLGIGDNCMSIDNIGDFVGLTNELWRLSISNDDNEMFKDLILKSREMVVDMLNGFPIVIHVLDDQGAFSPENFNLVQEVEYPPENGSINVDSKISSIGMFYPARGDYLLVIYKPGTDKEEEKSYQFKTIDAIQRYLYLFSVKNYAVYSEFDLTTNVSVGAVKMLGLTKNTDDVGPNLKFVEKLNIDSECAIISAERNFIIDTGASRTIVYFPHDKLPGKFKVKDKEIGLTGFTGTSVKGFGVRCKLVHEGVPVYLDLVVVDGSNKKTCLLGIDALVHCHLSILGDKCAFGIVNKVYVDIDRKIDSNERYLMTTKAAFGIQAFLPALLEAPM